MLLRRLPAANARPPASRPRGETIPRLGERRLRESGAAAFVRAARGKPKPAAVFLNRMREPTADADK
jgi:hypothetical protein